MAKTYSIPIVPLASMAMTVGTIVREAAAGGSPGEKVQRGAQAALDTLNPLRAGSWRTVYGPLAASALARGFGVNPGVKLGKVRLKAF